MHPSGPKGLLILLALRHGLSRALSKPLLIIFHELYAIVLNRQPILQSSLGAPAAVP